MARIKTKTYRFDIPADAVKVRMYYVPGNAPPTYAAPFVEADVVQPASQATMVIPGVSSISDGVYSLGATAFDVAGNESDIGAVVTSPFDFTSPIAPTNGAIL